MLPWHLPYSKQRLVYGLNLKIKYKSESYCVPPIATIDLIDVYSIKDSAHGNKFTLFVAGGDASSGYRATLVFRDGVIERRPVESGEFPKEHRDETIWTNKAPSEG